MRKTFHSFIAAGAPVLVSALCLTAADAQTVPVPAARPAALTSATPSQTAATDSMTNAPEPSAQPPRAPEVRQYCASIRDAAADARFAWQTATLQSLQLQVQESVAALEAKRAEYEEWLARREKFLSQATDDVVAIYSRMRPDAAAVQLAAMDDETAAAVLAKLKSRNSSAILNEMDPARAAQLTNTLAGASGMPTKGEKL